MLLNSLAPLSLHPYLDTLTSLDLTLVIPNCFQFDLPLYGLIYVISEPCQQTVKSRFHKFILNPAFAKTFDSIPLSGQTICSRYLFSYMPKSLNLFIISLCYILVMFRGKAKQTWSKQEQNVQGQKLEFHDPCGCLATPYVLRFCDSVRWFPCDPFQPESLCDSVNTSAVAMIKSCNQILNIQGLKGIKTFMLFCSNLIATESVVPWRNSEEYKKLWSANLGKAKIAT